MKHLLIVYHSQSGNTERLALAAAEGAAEERAAVETQVLRAADAGVPELAWADGEHWRPDSRAESSEGARAR